MKIHTKIYYDHFKIGYEDFVECELLGVKANDIHHIDCKGMGGDPEGKKDVIENLMAIARNAHDILGDNEKWNSILQEAHDNYLLSQTPFIVEDPFNEIFDALLNTSYHLLIQQKRNESRYNKNIF